jgi:hypothetical protein
MEFKVEDLTDDDTSTVAQVICTSDPAAKVNTNVSAKTPRRHTRCRL